MGNNHDTGDKKSQYKETPPWDIPRPSMSLDEETEAAILNAAVLQKLRNDIADCNIPPWDPSRKKPV